MEAGYSGISRALALLETSNAPTPTTFARHGGRMHDDQLSTGWKAPVEASFKSRGTQGDGNQNRVKRLQCLITL